LRVTYDKLIRAVSGRLSRRTDIMRSRAFSATRTTGRSVACDSLGYPARARDSRAVGGVDFDVVHNTGMYGDGLAYRHAPDPLGASGFAVGSHERIAVNPCPQHVEVAEQGTQPLLPRAASKEYLVKDQECAMTGHHREALVPDLLDGPEFWLHRHRAV
jgi:hypothetical protein